MEAARRKEELERKKQKLADMRAEKGKPVAAVPKAEVILSHFYANLKLPYGNINTCVIVRIVLLICFLRTESSSVPSSKE